MHTHLPPTNACTPTLSPTYPYTQDMTDEFLNILFDFILFLTVATSLHIPLLVSIWAVAKLRKQLANKRADDALFSGAAAGDVCMHVTSSDLLAWRCDPLPSLGLQSHRA